MTFELWNAVATTGTFLVIAVTAIVAIVQLRHARGSNQIIAMDDLREIITHSDFAEAQHFILTGLAALMDDPAFRYQLIHRAERSTEYQKAITKVFAVGNFYAYLGALSKMRLLDPDVVSSIWGSSTIAAWESLRPVVTVARRIQPDAWDNFEYAVVKAQDFVKAHPGGTYPRNVRRIPLDDPWLAVDETYAASMREAWTP